MIFYAAFAIVVIFLAYWLIKRASPPSQNGSVNELRHRPASKGSGPKPYAQLLSNGQYLPVSFGKLEETIEPVKREMREWKTLANDLAAHESEAIKTGDIDTTLISEAQKILTDVQERLKDMGQLYDNLFFSRESSQQKFYANIDILAEIESDLESSLNGLEGLRVEIDDSDFDLPTPKRRARKRPRKEN